MVKPTIHMLGKGALVFYKHLYYDYWIETPKAYKFYNIALK